MNGNKKETKAVKTVAVMMGATVVAKLLGMLRGILQAAHYGSMPAANAFTAASKLPLTFFDMLLAAAISGCFIPIYNSFQKDKDKPSLSAEGEEAADRFAGLFLTFVLLVCGILTLIGIIFAEPLIRLLTSGLAEDTVRLAVRLTRIMFPMVMFTGAAYTLVGVLQSKGSFIAPALISAVSNAGVVLYLLLIDGHLGEDSIYGLAGAYLVSWMIQLATLIGPLAKLGFRWKPALNFRDPALLRALKMAPPIMIGSWLAPAGILIGQVFAARVAASGGIAGATTLFDCANNVYVILAGTLTYSICNYTFPKIARLSAGGDTEAFGGTVRSGLLSALYITVPFMAAALVLTGEGVSILYRRGEFTAEDARYTAEALRMILLAMPFFCITELLTRVFYSRGLPSVPMWAAAAGIAANLISGWLLTSGENPGIGAVGLANAIGQLTAALILLAAAIQTVPGVFDRHFCIRLLKIALGGGICFGVCLLLYSLIGGEPYEAGLIANLLRALICFIPGAGSYLLFTKLARIRLGE